VKYSNVILCNFDPNVRRNAAELVKIYGLEKAKSELLSMGFKAAFTNALIRSIIRQGVTRCLLTQTEF
jgi:hypothetical protein